ncbi:MAG TPA: biopolymer transporter ExbD [Vicinamibacterales bacterium]|nr:biopolymer transporter ExbD [Vicinamibacterales bacterium]
MPKLEPIPNAPGRASGRRARAMRVSSSLAEINVVPLVDVMLVLLVIFMVAAPMMTQGLPIQLPEARKAQALDAQPIEITIPAQFRKDKQVYIGKDPVPLQFLHERVRQALTSQLNPDVTLAGDGSITYQELITVIDRLKEGGVRHVGLKSQPPIGKMP